MKFILRFKGGPGSGHHGHAGRPGMQGGSLPGKGGNVTGGVNELDYKSWIRDIVSELDAIGADYTVVAGKGGNQHVKLGVKASSLVNSVTDGMKTLMSRGGYKPYYPDDGEEDTDYFKHRDSGRVLGVKRSGNASKVRYTITEFD